MASKLEACAECKRKCFLCHSKSPLVTSFFKVMITENYSKVLFLPPKFAPTVSTLLGKEVPLEDSNGQQWKAKLTVFENSVALVQGWDTFAKDHGLEIGEFLLFHYVLGSRFLVQIFDRTCCEKLDFPMKTRAKAEKGSSVKQEPKSSAFVDPKVKTSRWQIKTTDVKDVKMAKNGALIDKKQKIPASIKMPFDRDSSNGCIEYQDESMDTFTIGSKRVKGAKDFSHNMNTFCDLKNRMRLSYKPSQEIVPLSGFDWQREKAKSRTKPKAEPVDYDPIYVPPIQCNNKFIKKAKLQASKTETLAINMAGSVSCVIGPSRSFLKLPEGLPSSSNKRRTMESSKRTVLLKGPKPKMRRVEYHETPRVKILSSGWEEFCKYNSILPGDECTFEVEDEAADTFRVTVVSIV